MACARVRSAFVVTSAIFFLGFTTASGQSTWTNTSGGLWNTAGNWSAGVPTAELAIFNLANTYTVTYDIAPSITTFDIQNGTVTFALGGRTLTTTASSSLVGSVPGQTGRLTVLNGHVLSAQTLIGNGSADTGFLTVSTGADWNVSTGSFAVGSNGNGTLTVNNGGQLSSISSTIGSTATSFGAATVTGAGSLWTIAGTGNLIVGSGGSGSLTVSSGGSVVSNAAVTIGLTAAKSGAVTVTGSTSVLDAGSNALVVGNNGDGLLTISGGGTVNSGASTVAANSGSTGDVTITGAGSTWNTSGQLIVGNQSAGTLTMTSGGTLNSTSASGTFIGSTGINSNGTMTLSGNGSTWTAKQDITIGLTGKGNLTVGGGATLSTTGNLTVTASTGKMTMNGGTVDVVGLNRNGPLIFNDGTLIVRGSYVNSSGLASSLEIDGDDTAALPTLELIGNSSVTQITSLTVGSSRQGALVLSDGRNLSVGANTISIGAAAGSNGSITLSGAGTQLTTTGTTTVGGLGNNAGGTGVLTIGSGSGLSTGTLNLFAGGTLNLNGGTLQANSYNDNGGAFNWTSGKMQFNADVSLSDSTLTRILGAGHSLVAGQLLTTATTPTMTLSGPVNVNGGTIGTANNLIVGTIVNGSSLTINSGAVNASAPGTAFTNNAGAVTLMQGTGLLTSSGGGSIINNGTLQLASTTAIVSGGTVTNGGAILGTGQVLSAVQNNAAGSIQVTSGQRLVFGGTVANAGLMSLVGGEMQFNAAAINIAITGLISGREAILRFNGALTNNGSLAFSNGTMDVFGDITSNHFVNSSDRSRITVSGGGTANFYDDVTVAPGQTDIQLSAAGGTVSKAVFFGSYNGGSVGGGTAFIEGDHRPGNSPGIVTFGGDLAYGGLASLHIEIGGTTPGNGPGHHDQVNVVGTAALGGTLDLVPFNGFVPVSGDKFVVMNYASATGTFSPVTGTAPAPGLSYTPIYTPTSLVILTTTNGEKTWAVDSSGNSSAGTNWTGGIAPGGVGDSANFSTIITAPRTVTLDADTTVGALKFDSPFSYTLAGPHTLTLQAAGAAAATINDSGVHGNAAHTISAPLVLASDLAIVQNSGGTLRMTGLLNESSAHVITKSGSGTAEISGSPTLGANTAIAVNSGTLRFAMTSGSPTLASGVSVAVNGTGTLELAGTVSALSSGSNRVNIVNSSTALGVLISGTNQIVGSIDGSGNTQINAGSDLAAYHIVQNALLIGGMAGSPAVVTIAASDASGNPLGSGLGIGGWGLGIGSSAAGNGVGSMALDSSLIDPQAVAASLSAAIELTDGDLTGSATGGANASGSGSAVPEPSTLLMMLLALSSVVWWRGRLRMNNGRIN